MTSPLTEQRLNELLEEASAAADYPATPALGPSVLAAVHAEATPNANRPTQRLLMAAAAVLVLAILGTSRCHRRGRQSASSSGSSRGSGSRCCHGLRLRRPRRRQR